MKKIVNWGVLGPGFIAHSFAKCFPKSGKCRLLAVSALLKEDADRYAETFGVPRSYGSYEELIADKDVDVIYIAVPTGAHYKYIKDCLNGGKHVLCEKTITMNAAHLKECAEIARKNHLILAEGLTSVYEPVMKAMKDKIQSGIYGKLHFITVTCGSCKEYDPNNRFFSPELGGGALFDIGCYAIGFANYFMSGKPVVVKSEGVLCDTGVDLKSAYVLKNQEDELATVLIALRSKTEKIGIIACEDAFIRIEGFIRANRVTVTYLDGRTETYEFPTRQLDAEVEAVTADILAGNEVCTVCPVDYTISILEVMDEARRQWGYRFPFESEVGVNG